jgi:hypothetical protein
VVSWWGCDCGWDIIAPALTVRGSGRPLADRLACVTTTGLLQGAAIA